MPCKLLINKAFFFLTSAPRGGEGHTVKAPKASEHATGLDQLASTRRVYHFSF